METCGLCLGHISNKFEILDFDKIQNIKSLVNLDITASEDAIICSKCAEICQKSFSFKTTCLSNNDYLKTLNHSNDVNKLILENVIVRKIKSEVKSEEEKVCYCCLNYFEATSVMEVKMEQNAFIKGMLDKCLPELDIDIVKNPLICFNCMELLKVYFDFISCCEVTVLVSDLNKNPGDVDTNAVIPKTENVDYTTDYNVIKTEEHIEESIETKYVINTEEDLDIEEDYKEFVNEIPKESNSLETVATSPSDNNSMEIFSCSSCLYCTPVKDNLVKHVVIHKDLKDVRQFKCDKCSFVAKRSSNLAEHRRIHQDITERKRHKCSECHFEALGRGTMKRHKKNAHGRSHEKNGQLKKYICHECGYETIHRRSILCHLAVHRQGGTPRDKCRQRRSMLDREKLYKCDVCEYESKEKKSLDLHLITHKDPSNMSMHKCAVCATECKYERSLRRHIQNHMSKEDLEMHQCQDCDYRGVNLFNLEQHYIKKHNKDVGEILYSCKGCEYRGKDKIELLLHRKTHRMVYACEYCTFESHSQYEYVVHSKIHSGSLTVRNFKCDSCKFESTNFKGFLMHLKNHGNHKVQEEKYIITRK